MSANAPELVAGILVLFFVPGYTLTKATFPEWRIRGSVATLRLLEVVTLSFVTSLALTVLVGYGLLTAGPDGFQAFWSDPLLETILAVIAAAAFAAGWFRGAYAREPPRPAAGEAEEGSPPWAVVHELDELRREERRVRHSLRRARTGSPEADALTAELDRIQAKTKRLQSHREEEYAS
ncbi:MAG TPA: DUF1616 domain-containing protein [Thermoplasmata archaeon]|nr:DUF1616 domain-containing protein [Thermoplasmata archaeon]